MMIHEKDSRCTRGGRECAKDCEGSRSNHDSVVSLLILVIPYMVFSLALPRLRLDQDQRDCHPDYPRVLSSIPSPAVLDGL